MAKNVFCTQAKMGVAGTQGVATTLKHGKFRA